MTNIQLSTGEGFPLALEPQDFVGRRVAVLGASGYGKTNTVASIIEELAPHIPMTIVDPEGEMWSLRERIDLIIVGRSENVDIEIEPHQAGAIATWSVEHGITVVLDLFEYDDTEIEQVTQTYVRALWEACKRKKRPYHLVIEEADTFMPQPLPRDSIWKYVAKRGRKYGLGMILASQRSQVVDKNILTQCQLAILHYVSHPRDMSVYKDLIPLKTREVESSVGKLRVGDAIVVDDGRINQVQIRLRHTHHPGSTPLLADTDSTDGDTPQLKTPAPDLVQALQGIIEAVGPAEDPPEIKRLKKEINELRGEKDIADTLIADLHKQVDAQGDTITRLHERIEMLRLIEVRVVTPVTAETQPVAVAAGGEPYAARRPATIPPAVHQPRMFGLSMDAEASPDWLINRQLDTLRTIGRWLKTRRKQDRLVLEYLAREDAHATLEEIALALGYEESTLLSNPPLELLNKGLIERTGLRGNYHYRIDYRKYPHLSEATVREELLKLVRD